MGNSPRPDWVARNRLASQPLTGAPCGGAQMAGYGEFAAEVSKFGPGWVLATAVGIALAVRTPNILKVVLTYLNERTKVHAKIEADRRKLDHQLSQRLSRTTVKREGRK